MAGNKQGQPPGHKRKQEKRAGKPEHAGHDPGGEGRSAGRQNDCAPAEQLQDCPCRAALRFREPGQAAEIS
jgi:hypothetical protein